MARKWIAWRKLHDGVAKVGVEGSNPFARSKQTHEYQASSDALSLGVVARRLNQSPERLERVVESDSVSPSSMRRLAGAEPYTLPPRLAGFAQKS